MGLTNIIGERVVITKAICGIFHMQVCAVQDATDEEILARCNCDNPSGTSHGWSKVFRVDDEFWGRTAPVECAQGGGRVHFMVGC